MLWVTLFTYWSHILFPEVMVFDRLEFWALRKAKRKKCCVRRIILFCVLANVVLEGVDNCSGAGFWLLSKNLGVLFSVACVVDMDGGFYVINWIVSLPKPDFLLELRGYVEIELSAVVSMIRRWQLEGFVLQVLGGNQRKGLWKQVMVPRTPLVDSFTKVLLAVM